MKIQMQSIIALLIISSYVLAADHSQYRNCIILLDDHDSENVGQARWFLISRIQSAIAEKSTPLLISATLWNSFIERKISFQQNVPYKKTNFYKIHNLYTSINERMKYWSNYYNSISTDIAQNKKLVIQRINKEFYHDKENISEIDYQFLLVFFTDFSPQEWDVYTNDGGLYLLIPKNYSEKLSPLGFKIDSLKKVIDPEDTTCIYFASHNQKSFSDSLPDFFLTYDDFDNKEIPYQWNIVTAGHGGSRYRENNNDGTIIWSGEPIINNLTLQEFKNMLEFFHSKVATHNFHYGTCYGAGNHELLIFENDHNNTYNFAIICDCLTDCTTYCKWLTPLPCHAKSCITPYDIIYDESEKCWQLPLTPLYYWKQFFNDISSIDFSTSSIERLYAVTKSITYASIANIPLLCLPNTQTFFPLQPTDVIKIDNALLQLAETDDEDIILSHLRIILIESNCVTPTIQLYHQEPLRIISIKPDDALHYIKKIEAHNYINLPSAFWQAEYQRYNKTFIIDECSFPALHDFRDIESQTKQITLKNIIITQQQFQYMRIFFTIDGTALMIIASKTSEESPHAQVKEIIQMTPAARDKYEEYYASLKQSVINS